MWQWGQLTQESTPWEASALVQDEICRPMSKNILLLLIPPHPSIHTILTQSHVLRCNSNATGYQIPVLYLIIIYLLDRIMESFTPSPTPSNFRTSIFMLDEHHICPHRPARALVPKTVFPSSSSLLTIMDSRNIQLVVVRCDIPCCAWWCPYGYMFYTFKRTAPEATCRLKQSSKTTSGPQCVVLKSPSECKRQSR